MGFGISLYNGPLPKGIEAPETILNIGGDRLASVFSLSLNLEGDAGYKYECGLGLGLRDLFQERNME